MFKKIRKQLMYIFSFVTLFVLFKVNVLATQTNEVLSKSQISIDLTTISDIRHKNIISISIIISIFILVILFISLNIYIYKKDKEELEYSNYED